MPRLLWYAPGGGLGHVTRAVAILRLLRRRLPDLEARLVVTTPYLHGPLLEGIPTVRLPTPFEWRHTPDGDDGRVLSGLLETLVGTDGPDLLVVDTHADGLCGELSQALLERIPHRALIYRLGGVEPALSENWPRYQLRLSPYPEPVHPETEAVGHVLVRGPDEVYTPAAARRRLAIAEGEGPVVLGFHAGDPGEVSSFFALLEAAVDRLPGTVLRLVTPAPLTEDHRPHRLHYQPVMEILPAADLTLSGAGYNSVGEVRALGLRALFCPFGRSHDRQDARVSADERFALTIEPAELAARILERLSQPRPQPASQVDGAARAAAALATLSGR